MKRQKINWEKIWRDFNNWMEHRESPDPCQNCGHIERNDPEWPEQQGYIQGIVDQQVQELLKDKT